MEILGTNGGGIKKEERRRQRTSKETTSRGSMRLAGWVYQKVQRSKMVRLKTQNKGTRKSGQKKSASRFRKGKETLTMQKKKPNTL